jgi:hypothetical protein
MISFYEYDMYIRLAEVGLMVSVLKIRCEKQLGETQLENRWKICDKLAQASVRMPTRYGAEFRSGYNIMYIYA